MFFSRKKNPRDDGEATRRHILETALRLFAEHGFADTTSKVICREAGVNSASVNYYFGSRDDLYRVVLNEVHEHIVNEKQMAEISSADISAEEKLGRILDAYIHTAYDGESLYARIWTHEMVAPSPLGGMDFLAGTLVKERTIGRVISEITGIPEGDPALQCCVLAVMAPYLLMFTIRRDIAARMVSIFSYRPEDINAYLKRMCFCALRDFAREYAEGRLPEARLEDHGGSGGQVDE